jgi:chemotaxis protein MotB
VRKKRPPEHANHERWLVSYADFVTLLFAFFTTMYAISTVDAEKYGRMVLSMRASFNGTVFPIGSETLSLSSGRDASTPLSRDLYEQVDTPKDKVLKEYAVQSIKGLKTNYVRDAMQKGGSVTLARFKQDVDALLKSRALTTKVRTRMDPRGLVISLGEGSCFDSGSDQLKAEGRDLLDALAPQLLERKSEVRVEGHTDDVPIRTVRFPSNWELSVGRSTAITRYLVESYGFAPVQLSASGYAEYRPVAPNDTPDGRARNRRVDIVVLSTNYSRTEPR